MKERTAAPPTLRALLVASLALGRLAAAGGPEALAPALDGIDARLDGVAWRYADAGANVRFGRERWRGPADLSFRYRLKVDADRLLLAVEVVDEKVLLRDAPTIVSDHVEVWLADPAIQRAYEARKRLNESNRESLFGEESGEELDEENEFGQLIVASIADVKAALRNDRWQTQILFHADRAAGEPKPVSAPTFRYETRDGGYALRAAIPFRGSMSHMKEELGELAFLVDVVDVDDEAARGQESLVSSSRSRRFADVATFDRLRIQPPVSLPLEGEIAELARFAPTGYARLRDGAWAWLIPSEMPLSGRYGIERISITGPFEEVLSTVLSEKEGLRITALGGRVLLRRDGRLRTIDLPSDAAGDWSVRLLDRRDRDGLLYLLFDVRGASRWPGGSTWCGAGLERNLVWLKLAPDLSTLAEDSVLYGSCMQWVASSGLSDEDELALSDGRLVLKVEKGAGDEMRSTTLVYDGNAPERGLVRRIAGEEQGREPFAESSRCEAGDGPRRGDARSNESAGPRAARSGRGRSGPARTGDVRHGLVRHARA